MATHPYIFHILCGTMIGATFALLYFFMAVTGRERRELPKWAKFAIFLMLPVILFAIIILTKQVKTPNWLWTCCGVSAFITGILNLEGKRNSDKPLSPPLLVATIYVFSILAAFSPKWVLLIAVLFVLPLVIIGLLIPRSYIGQFFIVQQILQWLRKK